MTPLAITARFPLGVYVGHRSDGSPDPFPDPARLHAALLNAAATGCSAVEDPAGLGPSPESLEALRWLEEHPPEGLFLPERRPQSADSSRIIFRKEGLVNPKKSTNHRRVSDGVSLNGPIGYRWSEAPVAVAETIRLLCADVAVLGETESAVVLSHEDFEPNLVLDRESSMFAPGGHPVRAPGPGRTAGLTAAHRAANPGKNPVQKATKSEVTRPAPVPGDGLTSLRYRSPEPPKPETPWSRVLLLELGGPALAPEERMDWAVAFHRALIAAIDGPVPAMVTGAYPKGQPRPANQLAIQYIPAGIACHHGIDGHGLALLVPTDAADEDLAALAGGLANIRSLYCRHGRRTLRFQGVSAPGDRFWGPAPDGHRRLWSPLPVAVTEHRSPRATATGGKQWGLRQAGVVSVAHVWRDEFPTTARGDRRLIELHAAASARGVKVGATRLVPGDSNSFVHKASPRMVPRMWSGLVDLGDLALDTAITAIGQSRHLGGGLLTPVDIPEGLYPTLMGDDND